MPEVQYMNMNGILASGIFSILVFAAPAQGNETVKQLNRKLDRLVKIEFTFDSYSLTDPSVRSAMKNVAAAIRAIMPRIPEGYALFVIGHASWAGSEEYNRALAGARARAVYHHLARTGVPPARMEYIEVGSRNNKREVTFEIRPYQRRTR